MDVIVPLAPTWGGYSIKCASTMEVVLSKAELFDFNAILLGKRILLKEFGKVYSVPAITLGVIRLELNFRFDVS